jgi:hypothetical protein
LDCRGNGRTVLGIIADYASTVTTDNTVVALGLRWKLANFAVDGELSQGLLSKGPFMITGIPGTPGVDNMFANLGVSLGF